MNSSDIREAFLGYFEKNGHVRVKSSSLVPANDPTLFFTNAGMVQFKDVFTGEDSRSYQRACSSQKCMRVSGKHNDLENVGHTPRHHTFFEMLGNFSFGDYFKEEAIDFGWGFLTGQMGLDKNRLYVTVFRDDEEAEKLWERHVPKNRILRMDEKDNFWAMGDTGPCGPCSEIHWDFGKGPVAQSDFDSDRFMEIWNLVFMQFNKTADGKMSPLAAPSIDTGMGLERLSAIMQGKHSNWESDLFVPIIDCVSEICGNSHGQSREIDISLRVIADHIRCATFLIGDGVIPSNEGRGYVLRRILRRAIRYGKRLEQNVPFLTEIIPVVIDGMGAAYPELATHQHFITKVIGAEEERFYETLDKGLELLKNEMTVAGSKIISGDVAFKLYDTFGFPLDVTQIIAGENGFSVDENRFDEMMNEQRKRARASWKGSGEHAVADVYKSLHSQGIRSSFVGYFENTVESEILAIVLDGKRVRCAEAGMEVSFVTVETPFYGESGGQMGDVGVAVAPGIEIEIVGTRKPLTDVTVHDCRIIKGEIFQGTKLTLAIDVEARQATRCNHTSTHLLHRALRQTLGEHVKQAGSLVGPSRFRFDFSHFQQMTSEELREVEKQVNESIRKNLPLITYELTYDEAVAKGALAFFGEKYGEKVRMIDISGHSMELCGGTHVSMTGEIGIFKILSESSVAAGVRRIEALTAQGALDYIEAMENWRIEIAKTLKAQPSEAAEKIKKLMERVRALEKDLRNAMSGRSEGGDVADLASQAREIAGIGVLVKKVDVPDRKMLAELAEKYRDKLQGVVLLAAELDGKIALVAAVHKSLSGKVSAGDIAKKTSEILGGKGGGRPDFAQGGGADIEQLDKALESVFAMLT
jgi:alanyl-tRNA synthetase